MNINFNGWVLLALVAILVLSYSFSIATMQYYAPVIAAQVGQNEGLVRQLNGILEKDRQVIEQRLTAMEKRLQMAKPNAGN